MIGEALVIVPCKKNSFYIIYLTWKTVKAILFTTLTIKEHAYVKTRPVYLAILESLAEDFLSSELKAQEAMATDREPPESNLLSMHEGVGIVSIDGKLTDKNSFFNSWYGLCSYDAIREAIVEAIELGAKSILFDVNSGGGSVNGMHELSSFIQGLPVSTTAFTGGSMCSAAYYVGASCDTVYCGEMAETGSIGVLLVHQEVTEALKKQGVKVDVIRSGSKKAVGLPYEKLSASNRQHLQNQVDLFANKFYSFCSDRREIPQSKMSDIKTGRTFVAEQAVTVGLVDEVKSFDEALIGCVKIAARVEKREAVNNGHTNFGPTYYGKEGGTMKKQLSKEALASMAGIGASTEASKSKVEPDAEATEIAAAAEATEDTPEMVEASELVAMTEKFDASQVELAELTVKLEASETEVADAAISNAEAAAPMVAVICAQINTMRVALSLSSVDMNGWEAAAIMKEYSSVSKTFESSLPTGGVVPDEEGSVREEVKQTRADDGDYKALSF